MSDHIRELLQRNLQEVFGEGSATRRRAAQERRAAYLAAILKANAFVGAGNHGVLRLAGGDGSSSSSWALCSSKSVQVPPRYSASTASP